MHLPPTEHLPDVAGGSPNTSALHKPRVDPRETRFEEEIDLGQYLRPLRRHWMIVVAACVLGALAGLLVSARRPTLYEASTTVLVQQAASGEAFSTARALLRNYTLASETIQELGLNAAPYGLTPQGFVERALIVEESGGTHLLNVKVRLADPSLAAKASHLLSTKAVQLNRRVASEGNNAIRDQLKVLLDDASRRLDAAEQELLAERSRARLDVLKRDTEVMLDGREEYQKLSMQIESEKGRLAAAEEELTHHRPLLGVPRLTQAEEALREAARPPGVPAVKEKKEPERSSDRGDAREGQATDARRPAGNAATADDRRAATANSDRREGANELRRSRPEIPPAQGLADPTQLDLSNPYVNPVYQTLQFQIAMSRAQLAGLERERRQIAGANAGGKDLGQLYRGQLAVERLENNYALAKRVYSELAVRYEQSRAESVGTMVQLQIVDPAMPPDGPMPRKRGATAAVGLAGGFFLGALIAIFATPKEPEAVEAAGTGRAHPRS